MTCGRVPAVGGPPADGAGGEQLEGGVVSRWQVLEVCLQVRVRDSPGGGVGRELYS